MNSRPKHIDSDTFIDFFACPKNCYLFLDIDGTLADFTMDPKDTAIPHSTLSVLQQLQDYGVAIAIVTGRSLIEAKQLLSPVQLPIAATHGLEIAADSRKSEWAMQDCKGVNTLCVDVVELNHIKHAIMNACMGYHGFLVEEKPYSVALHFRKNPTLADDAYRLMDSVIKTYPNWVLKSGKYVWEAVPKGANKGAAILRLLDHMTDRVSGDTCAIFIGDDTTDEAGFKAIQEATLTTKNLSQGVGIRVGREDTCAHYYVNDIQEVTTLLHTLLHFCQTHGVSSSASVDVNSYY